MAVEPLPCDAGGGTAPVEVTTCCAPSIASTPLCRPDGTTVLLVVRSGCVECGEAAPDPEAVGWINAADGAFTAGPPPADVGACDAGCVDTVCRLRCDDTDGDGEADTTYSELWCLRIDGTAELVLTYQDDPSQEYVPTSPVECVYGAQETETVPLCDTAPDGTVTAFLRRYTFLNGTATYEDVALDGQTPHVVAGTVGLCDTADSCAEPTTPAATLGLCLADGTPIAVIVTRDCNGIVAQDGWLNLTTGAWSAGDPPLGTIACGGSRSISVTGTFCDVDPDSGDVLGLVLVEYAYAADGSVDSVRLVDATTGQTYTPQGEVTTCPAGVEQPERDLVQLCDSAPDGTITEFVRDFARDESGQIVGHTDYTLDGAAYAPAGDVGQCTAPLAAPCQDCTTHVLCDTNGSPPATIAGTAASGTLPNGVTYATTAPSPFAPGRQSDGAAWWGVALFPNATVPVTRWTFGQPVTVDFSVAMVWSTATTLPGENSVQVQPGAIPLSLPSGYTYNQTTGILRADATLTGCTLNTPTRAQSARFRLTGVSTFTLQYLGSRVLSNECRRFGTWEFGALDVSLGGQFLRTVCRDCTGAATSTTDTLLDGETPYAPTGLVGVCQSAAADEEAPCRDSSQTLLCDTAAEEAVTVLDPANRPGADGWEIVSYTGYGAGYGPEAAIPYPVPHPAGNPNYMGVRSDLTVGPGPGYASYETAPVRWVMRKTFTAPEDGVAVVSSANFRGDGGARVRVNGQDAGMYGQWNQPATSGTAQIPVTAGPNTVEIEVRDGGGQNWLMGRVDIVMTSTVQFMRRTVVDCETGETVSVVDTTLDGDPYTATGLVGQCEPVAECCEPPPPETRLDVETHILCVVDPVAATVLSQVLVEQVYDDQTGLRTEQRITDPTTGDPMELPAGAILATCPATEPEECRNSSSLLLCDLPAGGEPDPVVTDTAPAPYYPYATGGPVAGAQALWDGGALTIPAGAAPQTGQPGAVATLAATVQAPRPACDTGTAHVTVSVLVEQTGPDVGCASTGYLRLFNTAAAPIALTATPANTPVGWTATLTVEADVPAADLAAGNIAALIALDTYDNSPDACPGSPRNTGWQLSALTTTVAYEQTGCETQFLRTVTVDCETGAVLTVTDTTLDGAPYTVSGAAGQCVPAGSGSTVVEPCGDTEIAQLCDLTYDPQAPIPTPAGDFALTGNVVAANGGTTLWFAQANQPATGIAELTVSGLLPATLYQFRFASAWIGAGGADPVGNAAIYRLDVLDGTTLLATRTRNVSNGSAVFPGGVLSEDMPPLPFIAPATGAVTIRVTDQTTGGAANDRDLFLMPFEVRTAVLTLNSTPFLRRFTFDCDGGLTSTQDLDLDGVTPYEVQGEVGSCAADGGTTAAVSPCDVQNVIQACRCDDTDGDGFADTDYVELIGVDCEGALTPMGTYLPDLSAPYTPAAPVDCDQTDEGAPPAVGVQARRVELAAGASWSAATYPTLQSVTAVAHAGTGTITTADGTSVLHTSEAATWSVGRADDALVTGPLTIAADTGTVTITFTTGVTL